MYLAEQHSNDQFSGVKSQQLRAMLFLVREIRLGLQGSKWLSAVILVCSLGVGGVSQHLGSSEIPIQKSPLETGKWRSKEAQQLDVAKPRDRSNQQAVKPSKG